MDSKNSKNTKKKKKVWVFVENESKDELTNHPEWTARKERYEVIFEPVLPTALEDWLTRK